MKIKQPNDLSVVYNPTIQPLDRTEIIKSIIKYFNFDDKQYAHALYLWGDGGIGKTYICRALDKYIAESYKEDNKNLKVHSIYYDLFKNSEYPIKLMELAMLIKEVLKEADLFEVFEDAFQIYAKKYQEQWNSNDSFNSTKGGALDTAIDIASCIPGISWAADFAQAGRSIIELTKSRRKGKEHQDRCRRLESIPLDDLRVQLCHYFAKDLNNYFKNNDDKRIVIILDTFESLLFEDSFQYHDYKLTDWLFGEDGILSLIKNTFWIIAGRGEIHWEDYDKDSYDKTFRNFEIKVPSKPEVVNYLEKTGMGKEFARRIADKTGCFPLHFGKYLNLYMRQLRSVYDISVSAETYILDEESFQKICDIVDDTSIISERFLSYFNQQDYDIIYTLACLKSWNDEILSDVIWKETPGIFSLYETIKTFPFIDRVGSVYEIRTNSLENLVKDCPVNLKKDLIRCIVNAMKNNDYFTQNSLLLKSLFHIHMYTPINAEFIMTIIQCLYKILNPIFRSLELKVIDDFCEDCINLLNKYKTRDTNYYLFRVNILVYKYICRQIYDVKRKKFLKEETINFLKEIKDSLDYLNEENLECGVYCTLDLVYEFSKKFSLFRDACNLMELFLAKYCNSEEEQQINEKIFTYKTYCTAIVIKAKFYTRSWAENEDCVYNHHIIDIENEESAYKQLKDLIEFVHQNHYGKEELLKDLIFYYIQSISINLRYKIQSAIYDIKRKLEEKRKSIEVGKEEQKVKLTKKETEIEDTDKAKEHLNELIQNNFGHKESITKYLLVYKANVDSRDITEQTNVRYLECLVNFAENNFKETVRLVFTFMHEKMIEFGTNLVHVNSFMDLFKYASKSLDCIEIEQDFIDEFSSMKESYEKLFNFVLTEFCKTCSLNYLNILETLNDINTYLFPEITSTWCKRILSINKIIGDSFIKNFILLGLHHHCEFIHNYTYFNVSRKQNTLSENELVKPLTSEQVQVVLNYMYVNNRICKEIIQDLNLKFHSTTGKDKASAGFALLVFYNKIASITSNFDIRAEEAHLYNVVLSRTNIKNLTALRKQLLEKSFEDFSDHNRTCFDGFCGWIFKQNFDDDRKFLQDCFDVLYEFMVTKPELEDCDSANLTLFPEFCNIMDFVLNRFKNINDFISLGYNLLKYIKYATDYDGVEYHVKPNFVKEKIMNWIDTMKQYYTASKFKQDPELVKQLTEYGLLNSLEAFDVGDLLLAGKFDEAKICWKEYSICNQSDLNYNILKKIYEPILFEPEEKINLFLEEIKNKVFSEETKTKLYSKDEDAISSNKVCMDQFALIEGYKFYKSEEEFLSLIEEILPYLSEVLFMDDNPLFFEAVMDPIIDILKYLMPVKAYDQVRYWVLELFKGEEELNNINKLKHEQQHSSGSSYIRQTQIRYTLLKNFSIISELYEASELFSDDLIGEIIDANSHRCIEVYNALKGYLPEEHLRELIIKFSAPILDEIFEASNYLFSEGGLDGVHYRRLQEILGDDLDLELRKYCTYFAEAREIYLKNYRIYS